MVGRIVGLVSKETYLPEPINGKVFSPIPGQTTKLVGLSPIIAYGPTIIKSKCVTAMINTLTETFILTALPNNFETDSVYVCFNYVINENVSWTTEIYVSKIFSMKYIFLPYFFI